MNLTERLSPREVMSGVQQQKVQSSFECSSTKRNERLTMFGFSSQDVHSSLHECLSYVALRCDLAVFHFQSSNAQHTSTYKPSASVSSGLLLSGLNWVPTLF